MDSQLTDLFISCGESSGDLHGSTLIEELLQKRPHLKIGAVAGPKMRKHPIQAHFQMESLMVMGFIDVLTSFFQIAKMFFAIRKKIIELNPKAVILIDYPGLHLRLARSLKKKGYRGKIIQLICPTVWAWGKKRIPLMADTLDKLLTIFPFEPACFSHTKLEAKYIGHPLIHPIQQFIPTRKFTGKKILGIFPGSRKAEIARNLPLQIKVAKKLQKLDPDLEIAISSSTFLPEIKEIDALIVKPEDTYELMRASHLAIATSGTVCLELALHGTPTVVTYAIRKLDCWIAQNIFRINLPFYCIVNIIENCSVFPELFGPNLREDKLTYFTKNLWFDQNLRKSCKMKCLNVRKSLGMRRASQAAAEEIFSTVDF